VPSDLKSLTIETKSELINLIRPALNIHWDSELNVIGNKVQPVTREFNQNGVKAIVTISEDNRLVAEIIVPQETVTNTVSTEKKISSPTLQRPLTKREIKKGSSLGWRSLLLISGAIASLIAAYFRYSKKKNK